jgi:hypothetical protein
MKTIIQNCFEFIWHSKRDKVKRDVIIQDFKYRGLNMIDLPIFMNSIKSSWIKRLYDKNNHGLWKEMIKKKLQKIGGLDLFKSNSNANDIKKFKIKNTFLKELLLSWSKINFNKNPQNLPNNMAEFTHKNNKYFSKMEM